MVVQGIELDKNITYVLIYQDYDIAYCTRTCYYYISRASGPVPLGAVPHGRLFCY